MLPFETHFERIQQELFYNQFAIQYAYLAWEPVFASLFRQGCIFIEIWKQHFFGTSGALLPREDELYRTTLPDHDHIRSMTVLQHNGGYLRARFIIYDLCMVCPLK